MKKVVELRPKKVEVRLKASSNMVVRLILKVPLELRIESKLESVLLRCIVYDLHDSLR